VKKLGWRANFRTKGTRAYAELLDVGGNEEELKKNKTHNEGEIPFTKLKLSPHMAKTRHSAKNGGKIRGVTEGPHK